MKALFSKLNPVCLKTLSSAVGTCGKRRNDYVEVAHWLLELFEAPDTDITRIVKQYSLDVSRITRDLNRNLEQMKRGSGSKPGWSREIEDWIREAWTLTTLNFNAYKIRTGFLLTALMADKSLHATARAISAEFDKLPGERLLQEVRVVIVGSGEEDAGADAPPAEQVAAGQPATAGSKTPSLDQF